MKPLCFAVILLVAGWLSGCEANAQTSSPPASAKGAAAPSLEGLSDPRAAFEQAMRLLMEQHVDKSITQEELYRAAIEGMTRAVAQEVPEESGSPHKLHYLLPPADQARQADSGQGYFTGIGVFMQLESSTGRAMVSEVMPGSPAERSGLRAGDVLLKWNDIPVGTPEHLISKPMVTEALGTEIRLVVLRGGQELTFRLSKERIALPSVSGEIMASGIGVIRLRYLTPDTPSRVAGLLKQFRDQRIRCLVLDVRACEGSSLDTALQVLDLLVPEGKEVLRLEDRKGSILTFSSHGKPLLEVPVYLLADESTGLAGEVIARALDRQRQAKVIGQPTGGRTLVTDNMPLPGGYALRVPVRRVLPLEAQPLETLSVRPDVFVAASWDQIQSGYRAPDMERRGAADPGFRALLEMLR